MSPASGDGGVPGGSTAPGTEEAARRLEDVFALSGRTLRELVPVPPVTSRAGRVILAGSLKRMLLRSSAIRRAVGTRARRRAEREGAGA